MPTTQLRQLVKQERHARISLENIEEFLSTYQEERDKCTVQLRLKKLDDVYEKYCELRVNIEVLTDDLDIEPESAVGGIEEEAENGASRQAALAEARQRENAEIFKEFENKYFDLKQKLLSKIGGYPGAVGEPKQEVQPQVSQVSRTRYPELKLPTFSGRLLDWMNFRDNFTSLIHDNNHLSTIDKFNYLRTSLKDEALYQINQIQVTAVNYELAWGILESKYENHKLIAQEHLKALFSVAPMKSESFQALNHLLMTFKINLQQLEKLGANPDQWSTLLAFMLSQKLDDDTLRLWETHHSSKNIPSYQAMVDFLENHCTILQSTSARKSNDFKKFNKNPMVHAAVSQRLPCLQWGTAYRGAVYEFWEDEGRRSEISCSETWIVS